MLKLFYLLKVLLDNSDNCSTLLSGGSMRRGFRVQCSACGKEFFAPITKEIRPYVKEHGLRSLLWFRCPYCDKEFESYPVRFEARRRVFLRWWDRVTHGQPRLKFTFVSIPVLGGYVAIALATNWLPDWLYWSTGVIGVVGCLAIYMLYLMSGPWWSRGHIIGDSASNDNIFTSPIWSDQKGNIWHDED